MCANIEACFLQLFLVLNRCASSLRTITFRIADNSRILPDNQSYHECDHAPKAPPHSSLQALIGVRLTPLQTISLVQTTFSHSHGILRPFKSPHFEHEMKNGINDQGIITTKLKLRR